MFDKDDQEISQLIDASLEAVLSGKATLEQVMAEHPQQADALRREIEAAMWLVARREQVAARPGFTASSRRRVIERIKEEASNTGAKRSIFGFIWPQKIAYQWVAALLALIVLFSSAGGVVSYAQGALPGEGLYPVKLATEKLQYSLTANELERVEVIANFTNRRLQEVVTLVQQGETEALGSSIETFEEHVVQTVDLLEESSDQQPHEKKVLAVNLQETFTEQAEKLDALKEKAPKEVQPDLERARALTMMGASAAFDEAAQIYDPTETPTPTLTPSQTPTNTATPTATQTETPVPVVPTWEEDPGVTGPADTEDPTDEVEKKPSKTPKPMPSQSTPGKPEEKPPKPPPKEDNPNKPPKESGNSGN